MYFFSVGAVSPAGVWPAGMWDWQQLVLCVQSWHAGSSGGSSEELFSTVGSGPMRQQMA